MRKATVLLFTSLVCLSAMACKPQHAARGVLREQRLEQRQERGEHRGGLRRDCRDDIEKFCAADQTGRDRRLCLQSHLDQLSAGCKTAVQDRMNRHGGGRRNRDQNGATTNQTGGTNNTDDDNDN
jgi:hypothetical protein